MAGSIPVHLRQISPQGEIRALGALDSRCGWPEAEPARTGFAASSSLLFLLVLLTLMVGFAAPAGAAARLLSSTPVEGASLSSLRQIEFEFDSLLIADGASITVIKLDGTEFPVESTVDQQTLSGTVVGELPSGNYEVGYSVRSADGDLNTGSIRVGVDSPSQALSGGLLAVIGIGVGLFGYLLVVFRADKKRRPQRRVNE